MDPLWATLCYHHRRCLGRCQVILRSAHLSLELANQCLQHGEPAGGFVYDPVAGVCLPAGQTHKTYAAFVIPAVFDVVILTLTALKTYRFAAALRRQSGSAIVRAFLTILH